MRPSLRRAAQGRRRATNTLLMGDATSTYATADSTSTGHEETFQFVAKESGTIGELQFLTNGTANTGVTSLILGIMSDVGGKPGVVLGQGTFVGTPGINTWVPATGISVALVAATKYWLAVLPIGGAIHYNVAVAAEGTGNLESVAAGLTKITEETEWSTFNQGPVGFQAIGVRSGGGNPTMKTGMNSGFEENDQTTVTTLKPKIVRLGLGIAECTPEIVTYICEHYATLFGAEGVCLVVSFSGEYGTTKVKGEKISKKVSSAQVKALKLLAGIPGLKYIEFGNETSYGYQYGDGFTEASYKERAKEYALLLKEAAEAMASVGMPLPMCQADDGNSSSSVWVDEMYSAVPELHNYVSAWVIHPYGVENFSGPSGPRITRMISQVSAHGGGAVPIDVTEWGIPSDNGIELSDGTKYTYAAARILGEVQIAEIKAAAGTKLRQLLMFQGHDQRKHAEAGENREWYFGGLTLTNTEKTLWSPFIKQLLSE